MSTPTDGQIYGLTNEDVFEFQPKDFDSEELLGIMLDLRGLKATNSEEVCIYLKHVYNYVL